MNLAEFSKEFDLGYNNSFDFSAPPINSYEKSLYLTQAQEDLVKELYRDFDKNEKIREQLRNLTIHYSYTFSAAFNAKYVTLKLNTNSKFVEVPTDVWFILNEYVNGDIIVIPVALDEYAVNINNPYKKPTTTRAWRLDLYNSVDTDQVREIIFPDTITTYTMRYLKKPPPIILESLTPFSTTIEGSAAATNCILSTELHRTIVEKAIQKAKLNYEENTLQNRVINREN